MLDWRHLVWLPENELARLDIAEVNMACAAGLPGLDRYNPAEIIQDLNKWADRVHQYTVSAMDWFWRKPLAYGNSEAYFRAVAMVTVLQRDLGLRYNLAKKSEDIPLQPEDTFIHGAVRGAGGICTSIPVVIVAVGRRLGYPIKLVRCLVEKWGHVFARWESPDGERVNIEATNRGMWGAPRFLVQRNGSLLPCGS